MADQPRPDGAPTEPERHNTVRREKTDASFPWILGLVIGSAFFGIVIHLVVWLIYRDNRASLNEIRKSPFPLAPRPDLGRKSVPPASPPPEPRLEELDRFWQVERPNVYARQKAKEDVLRSYGPADEKGFVHIPIEQAIQYLATTKKLPVREAKGAEVPRDNGLVGRGEPNSGRLLQRRKPRWFGP